jgi:hypothetical protein
MHPSGMGWSWDELQATPIGVRTACWDFIRLERAAQVEHAERAKREQAAQADGKIRVQR